MKKNNKKLMTPAQNKRITDAENRITVLENNAKLTSIKLEEISNNQKIINNKLETNQLQTNDRLEEIKTALIGSTEDIEKSGIVPQYKVTQKKVENLEITINSNIHALKTLVYENKNQINKYNWYIRGLLTAVSIIILYTTKVIDGITKLISL